MKELIDLIKRDWDKTVRTNSRDDSSESNVIAIPCPFTSPTKDDHFSAMYYWDTYFTNEGLILSDRLELAKDNVENIAYLINELGYMPNANRTNYFGRSQPPFFSLMVRSVYDVTNNNEWLCRMFVAIKKEYDFWQEKRMTSSGLNAYSCEFTREDKEIYLKRCNYMCDRLSLDMPQDDEQKYNYARSITIFCESGWDCTSRMGLEPYNYAHIDLNSILFGVEKNMEYFSHKLGLSAEADIWRERSEKRKCLINSLCESKRGFFADYNFVKGKASDFFSAASFYPLFFEISDKSQAENTVKLLPLLERTYGLSSSEVREDLLKLQWDEPFGWPCLHYIVISGLLNYGYAKDAMRLAKKYVDLVENNYRILGEIFEKYDVSDGVAKMSRENKKIHPMMGWSAGVYLWCKEKLGELNK